MESKFKWWDDLVDTPEDGEYLELVIKYHYCGLLSEFTPGAKRMTVEEFKRHESEIFFKKEFKKLKDK